jgi:hypothetical protein
MREREERREMGGGRWEARGERREEGENGTSTKMDAFGEFY